MFYPPPQGSPIPKEKRTICKMSTTAQPRPGEPLLAPASGEVSERCLLFRLFNQPVQSDLHLRSNLGSEEPDRHDRSPSQH